MSELVDEDRRLIRATVLALVNASVVDGKAKLVLPSGGRQEVEHLLARAIANPWLLGAYCVALNAELYKKGIRFLTAIPDVDIPVEEICREGLGCCTDEQIASVALNSIGLELLSHFVDEYLDEDLSEAWFKVIAAEGQRDIEAAGLTQSVKERIERLMKGK